MKMTEISGDVLSIMAGAAFDTIEQMDAAYCVASEALGKILAAERAKVFVEAAGIAYSAVDEHLWDASVAEKVQELILSKALPTPPQDSEATSK
jgi:hypothetical protein